MKSTRLFFRNWMLLGMLALGTSLSGCYSNESDLADGTMLFRSTGSGAQERPTPVVTAASGSMTGRYEPQTRRFTYTLSWNRLTDNPTMMHFHGPATPESVAPPVVTITGFPARTSGSVSQTVTLTEEQAQQLMNQQWYFNIHTPMYPAGEVRGHVMMGK